MLIGTVVRLCGLRCMEVRNLRLCDLDFDRKQLKVVQGKGKKRPLFATFRNIWFKGIKKSRIEAEKPENYLFGMPREGRLALTSLRHLIPDILQQGVQWAVKQASKTAKYWKKWVFIRFGTVLRRIFWRWDGYFKHQKSLGHENIETRWFISNCTTFTQKLFFTIRYPFSEFGKKWEVLKP